MPKDFISLSIHFSRIFELLKFNNVYLVLRRILKLQYFFFKYVQAFANDCKDSWVKFQSKQLLEYVKYSKLFFSNFAIGDNFVMAWEMNWSQKL